MRRITNHELMNSLITATEQDRIDWQATAAPDQYAASFGGKWTVIFDRSLPSGFGAEYWLELKNSEGETVVRITQKDDNRIPELFETVRRNALKIDAALADFLNEINGPQK